MNQLMKIKEALEGLYSRHERILRFFGKMILGFLVFYMIRKETGYMEKLNSPILLTGLSVLCGFLPANLCVLLATAIVLLHLYSLSWCALAVGGGILLILLLLYFGVAPDYGYAFLLTPVALSMNIPMAAPVILGLTSHSSSLFGMLFGTVWYYMMKTAAERAEILAASQVSVTKAADIEKIIQEGTALAEGILKRRELLLTLVAFLAVWLIVKLGRQMKVRYAWSFAIGAGTAAYVVIAFLGGSVLEVGAGLAGILLSAAAALLLSLLVQMFVFLPDYRKTESVEFEDDDYYYYVTAVPKMRSVSAQARQRRERDPEPGELTREERRRQRREREPEPEEYSREERRSQRRERDPEPGELTREERRRQRRERESEPGELTREELRRQRRGREPEPEEPSREERRRQRRETEHQAAAGQQETPGAAPYGPDTREEDRLNLVIDPGRPRERT